MTISSGTKLGRYEIRSKIGAGGMGRCLARKFDPFMKPLRDDPRFQTGGEANRLSELISEKQTWNLDETLPHM